ncbi:VOC family protein [Pseudacidovorax intermedius]|uniref:VOC family protein n=1 Tax=Pseudacidovorax intermedius TaxID=433924 RepID=UPI0003479541|nr:hypothetical protein [Pseudacidovorax intermedius]
MTAPDRAADSIGNIVLLEHYNATVDDQRLATLFYVTALGGTRDPYLFTGLDNMWVNFGRTQVHLPSRGAAPRSQLLRGTLGFVVPDLDAMRARLDFAEAEMQRVAPGRALQFDATDGRDCIDLHCPWGTRVRCHAPSDAFDGVQLGLVYIDFDVPPGTVEGIARFYDQVIGTPSQVDGRRATVCAGLFQTLRFTECDAPLRDYDGHHFLIYLADFARPHAWLREHGLLTRDDAPHEWRFEWICDPRDGRRLFQVEHEVRSTRHPLYNRVLVNRDTALTNVNYRRGREDFDGIY